MHSGQLEGKTHTLKNDRHFLLVDDKIGLEEDAENDPCDLHGDKKRAIRVESERTVDYTLDTSYDRTTADMQTIKTTQAGPHKTAFKDYYSTLHQNKLLNGGAVHLRITQSSMRNNRDE